VFGANNNHVIH